MTDDFPPENSLRSAGKVFLILALLLPVLIYAGSVTSDPSWGHLKGLVRGGIAFGVFGGIGIELRIMGGRT